MMGIVMILITVTLFIAMRSLYHKFHYTMLNPVVTTTGVLIILLLLLNLPYDTYMVGGYWIQELLGPAVVAFAYPLYRQKDKIIRYRFPLFAGLLTGITTGIGSGFMYVKLSGLSKEHAVTFLPKSVTSPIAMDIASLTGGIPSLAAALVILSGIMGAVTAPKLLNYVKIKHYLSVGVGLGCAAHGIGTAKAMEYGEGEAAFSSISMTISALLYALVLPITIHYFL